MFDLGRPIPMSVIVGSIVLILGLVGIGLAIVAYYKRKMNSKVEDEA